MKAIEHYTRTSRGDVTAMEVTRLRSLTAKRKEGEFDLELSIGALTEELCGYPEDVVRTVCREWARNNKFFPVLKELIDACNELMILRQAVLSAFKSCNVVAMIEREPAKPARQERHGIPKTKWDAQHWSEYVKEAQNMVKLAENSHGMIDKASWDDVVASRSEEKAAHIGVGVSG